MQVTTATSIMVRAWLSLDERDRLHEIADRQGLPASRIIGKLIRDYVEEHDPSDYGRAVPHSRRKRRG